MKRLIILGLAILFTIFLCEVCVRIFGLQGPYLYTPHPLFGATHKPNQKGYWKSKYGEFCEVINSGCSGWGTDRECLFYEYEGKKYNPDLVPLFFCLGNDIRNNHPKLEGWGGI